jgi:crossover junction endodeoxyribonuclease RusA
MSPNARVHRMAVAPIRREYRETCGWLTKAAKLQFPHMEGCNLHIRVTFHPPDNRKRDIDNMLASIKSGLDGVADATGVDDNDWEITMRCREKVKGGAVIVEVGDDNFTPWTGH